MKKILLLFVSFLAFAGRGGAIAGGILGGMFLGNMLTSMSQPRERVVVVENRDNYYLDNQYSEQMNELDYRLRQLERKERELEKRERYLANTY